MRIRLSIASVLALSLCCACHDHDESPGAEAKLDGTGGTVTITSGSLAGASITIPPGALVSPVAVQIWADNVSLVADMDDVGPAARFEPHDVVFTTPATITLPFDVSLVPADTPTADYRLGMRTSDGRVSSLVPANVDVANGRVTASVTQLAVFWVVVPIRITTADYLPLADGNEYLFDTAASNRLAVDRVENQPGLTRPAWLLTFFLPWFHRTGLLLEEDGNGGLSYVGLLQVIPQAPGIIEVNDTRVQYLAATEVVGRTRTSDYTYSGYRYNNGIATPTHTGSGSLVVKTVKRASVDTRVGRFGDTVEFEFSESFIDTFGGSGAVTSRVWLARGIGPVQLQFGDDPPIPLASGTVDGQPIRGQ